MRKKLIPERVWAFLSLVVFSLSWGKASAEEITRPAYRFLRWEEDWSGFEYSRLNSVQRLDTMKYISLGDGNESWLSLGGDFRVRGEYWTGFNFGLPREATHEDTFVLTRYRLHGDLHFTDKVRFFAEIKGAFASDRSLPGGVRAIDEDTFELQQAFLDLPFDLGFESPVVFRVGRQQFAFGGQRLVSPLPWANSLRTWDGARVMTRSGHWNVDTFAAAFVPVDPDGVGRRSSGQKLYGVYAKRLFANASEGLELYALRNEFDERSYNGTEGDEKRWTLGFRSWGSLFELSDYEIELSYQTGSVGRSNVSAWSIASKVGYPLRRDGSLKLWAGFDWASGDNEKGGEVNTFNQLYPLGHAYFGIADVIGRQNIVDTSAGISWRPKQKLNVKFAVHSFQVDAVADAIYNPGGGVVRAGGSFDSKSIGWETDATLKWSLARQIAVDAGYAHFFPESAIDQSGPAEDIDFLYLGASYVF